MIPKVIHYVWVGGKPLSPLAEKCIDSWKKYCPGYEIKRWDEKSFDISSNPFCKEAYENKKWAFVSDYIRLKVLYEEGGIYMDTDVEVIKPLDDYLKHPAFSGFECTKKIPTGIIAAEKDNKWIKLMLDFYKDKHFVNPDGSIANMPNVLFMSELTEKNYKITFDDTYQDLKDIVFYPHEIFCPDPLTEKKYFITNNTVTIHHFAGSWTPKSWRFKKKLKNIFKSFVMFFIGQKRFEQMKEKKNKKQHNSAGLYKTLEKENSARKNGKN